MKHQYLLLILFPMIIASCGPGSQEVETMTATAKTAIAASWTRTPTSTSTSTLTPSPTTTSTPTTTFTPTSTNSPTMTGTDVPTRPATSTPTDKGSYPETISVEERIVTFLPWGLTFMLGSDDWQFNPDLYEINNQFELITFSKRTGVYDQNGIGCKPSIAVILNQVPTNTNLILFSTMMRLTQKEIFPVSPKMFGYEGSEPELLLERALGYYGVMPKGSHNSVYIIHAVEGEVGVQIIIEFKEETHDQLKTELYEMMGSFEFIEN